MNRTGKTITHIAIHCTAGHGDLASIRKFWRSLGWKTDGYHLYVDYDGTITQLVPFNLASNGVKGFNEKIINITYRGGVEKTNVNKASDTRTPQQKEALVRAIKRALQWVEQNGGDVGKVKIQGHRDFSPDKNGNGVIDSWERIKECPSFDAIPEYKNVIPEYLKTTRTDMEYVVRSGDTLFKIATAHNTTVEVIKKKNPSIGSNNVITVGQRLKI
jgi:N-acetylmuramoyl-L-alanine amidase